MLRIKYIATNKRHSEDIVSREEAIKLKAEGIVTILEEFVIEEKPVDSCQGFTAVGNSCNRKPQEGSLFCFQHQPNEEK